MRRKANPTTDMNIRMIAHQVELREADPTTSGKDKDYIVRGYAALYESPSDSAGWYTEVLKRGCFAECIAISDIRALINHDPNIILARYKPGRESNTLKVWSDDTGLGFEFMMPRSQAFYIEAIQRGDLTQNSFAFSMKVGSETWTEKVVDGETLYTREIEKVSELFDVSIVTYPFYEDTYFTMEQKSWKDKYDAQHSAKETNPTSTENKKDIVTEQEEKANEPAANPLYLYEEKLRLRGRNMDYY